MLPLSCKLHLGYLHLVRAVTKGPRLPDGPRTSALRTDPLVRSHLRPVTEERKILPGVLNWYRAEAARIARPGYNAFRHPLQKPFEMERRCR